MELQLKENNVWCAKHGHSIKREEAHYTLNNQGLKRFTCEANDGTKQYKGFENTLFLKHNKD